jgi:DinB superfamily
MTPELDAVRATLIRESSGRSWYDLWPRVTAGRAALLLALEDVDEATARRRPASGEGEASWSIAEVVRHVLHYTVNVRMLVEELSRGRPAIKGGRGLLAGPEGASFEELRRQLIADSVSLASLPEQLPADPSLELTATHAVLGQFNCRGWYLFFTLHDGDHTRQIRSLRGMRDSD